MARSFVIALVAAVLLSLVAAPLDVLAIIDWRQNALDTGAMVATAICMGCWICAGLLQLYDRVCKLNMQTRKEIGAAVGDARRRIAAADMLGRLTADEPTMPMPIPIRRVP